MENRRNIVLIYFRGWYALYVFLYSYGLDV